MLSSVYVGGRWAWVQCAPSNPVENASHGVFECLLIFRSLIRIRMLYLGCGEKLSEVEG